MLSPSITCLNDDVRDAPVDHQAGGGEAGQSKAGKQRRAGAAVHLLNHEISAAGMTERQPSTANHARCRLEQRAAGEAEHRCAFCGSQRDAHR